MSTLELITAIDSNIARLQQARALLAGRPVRQGLSEQGRLRIATAQRRRWAKYRKAAK